MLQVAILSTLACVILVVNSVLCFLPLVTKIRLPDDILTVEAVLGVVACAMFVVGSAYALYCALELNGRPLLDEKRRRDRYSTFEPVDVVQRVQIEQPSTEKDILRGRRDSVLSRTASWPHTYATVVVAEDTVPGCTLRRSWRIFFTPYFLRTRDKRKLQLLGNSIGLFSCVIYSLAAVTSLVMILQTGTVERWIRFPQLVAGFGFASSAFISMNQFQAAWWRPAVCRVVWHANFWNFVGSVGFIVCAAYGLMEDVPWAEFQFVCSYLWGESIFCCASIPVRGLTEG